MTLTWVVQSNLGSSSDVDVIRQACDRLGLHCRPIAAIPFDTNLPEAMYDIENPVIVYGATGFVTLVHSSRRWTPGAFFNHRFNFPVWRAAWGLRCLNADAEVTTIGEFATRELDPDAYFFVRPTRDLKEFSGEVVLFGDFTYWYQRISHGEYTVTPDCPIVVAEPVGIEAEWRLFMVDGKVSSGSRYRTRGRLDSREQLVDGPIVDYAEETAAVWSPAPVFVLDVCRTGGLFYVVETGCFNSAGFYAASIDKIVEDVSRYVKEHR